MVEGEQTISERQLGNVSLDQRISYLESMCETLRSQRAEALSRIEILEAELEEAIKCGYKDGVCYGHN